MLRHAGLEAPVAAARALPPPGRPATARRDVETMTHDELLLAFDAELGALSPEEDRP